NADQWRTPLYAGSAAERDRLTLLGKLRHRAGSRRVVGFAGLPNCALKSTKSLNSIGSVATPSSRDIASSCAQLLLEHNRKAYDSKLIVRAPTATSIPNSGRCEPRTSAAAIGPCALDSKRLGSRSLRRSRGRPGAAIAAVRGLQPSRRPRHLRPGLRFHARGR